MGSLLFIGGTDMDYREDYYIGGSGFYFKRIIKTIINFGELTQEPGPILDFGCGVGHLKKTVGATVVGYDIIPELSDVTDYRKVKPTVIVCNNILEHFDLPELERLLRTFKKMNSKAKLITAIPTENILSRIGMLFTGEWEAHADHKSKLKEINTLLDSLCVLHRRKRILTLSEVSLWTFRP